MKDRVGRRRYVLAIVPGGTTKDDLISLAKRKERDGISFWVIDHRDGFALVRCKHHVVREVCHVLNSEGFETVVTSGTISGAERRASERGVVFKARRKRKHRRPKRVLR